MVPGTDPKSYDISALFRTAFENHNPVGRWLPADRVLVVAAGIPGGHEHTARSAWLIVVPVLAVLLVAPPALGADSVLRTRKNTEPGNTEFGPLPPGDVVSLSVGDFVDRAGWDEHDSLDGRTVRLTGFVVRTTGGPQLARLTISCCAADAFAVRTGLTGGRADLVPQGTWVEVTGRLVPADDTRARDYVPDLAVRTLREIPRPDEPYET